VYVRRPKQERASLFHFDNFIVTTPSGGEVPLSLAADVKRGESFTLIERENASRAVDVSADIDIEVTTPNDVARAVEISTIPRLLDEYPGLTWEKSGQQLMQQRSFAALSTGLTVALLVMFALMAMVFKSYVQPIIILAAIPFGVVGAILGHLLMGFNLSLVSVLGMVALAGVVVNDSLVLVARANELSREAMAAFDAVVNACVQRFRPVMLTSLTTFFGLAPMILETSVQARFLIPMALSLGFGVLFVTFIALGMVPVLFLILDDLKWRTNIAPAASEST
jgi:multidrug efflux pump subunit AcrB